MDLAVTGGMIFNLFCCFLALVRSLSRSVFNDCINLLSKWRGGFFLGDGFRYVELLLIVVKSRKQQTGGEVFVM